MKEINILVIGAGGIASYAMPLLARMYKLAGFLMDGDTLETRNLERQDFQVTTVGRNKAEALIQSHKVISRNQYFKALPHYFTDSHMSMAIGKDVIFCFADNRTAKVKALMASDQYGVPCIIAGNEFVDNEAWYYNPDYMRDTLHDPRVRYKGLTSDKPDEDDPVSCSAPEAQVIHPQLAMANMGAAHKAVHLLWLYLHMEQCIPEITQRLTSIYQGHWTCETENFNHIPSES